MVDIFDCDDDISAALDHFLEVLLQIRDLSA